MQQGLYQHFCEMAQVAGTPVPSLASTGVGGAAGGSVQEQQPGCGDEAGGDVEAAPHPTGVRLRLALLGRVEIEHFEQLGGALFRAAGAEAAEATEQERPGPA
jgi:hypothetical protein